ncbi:MAG: GNAT family N-acetyltransferase, partial [Candidatus Limnocylindrales bacterium]
MSLVVRHVSPGEFESWVATLQTAFFLHASIEADAEFRARYYDMERVLGAFDGSRAVGTFRSFATQLTVPGGQTIAADAVTNVTVAPTHRRQGAMRGMMTADLDAARQRGEPVAILMASEGTIYGRFGFAPATEHTAIEIDSRAVRFIRPELEAGATVEPVEAPTLRELAPAIFDRTRLADVGSIERSGLRWDLFLGIYVPPAGKPWQGWQFLCRDAAGEPQGYLRYHVEEKWECRVPRNVLIVDELVAATPAVYARLWRLACEMDLVTTVKADDRRVDELLPWLLIEERAVRQTCRSDHLWLRILDPAAALSARRYLAPGRLVLEVADENRYAAGRFVLDGGPDGADCRATDRTPDLRLGTEALAAAYLGG